MSQAVGAVRSEVAMKAKVLLFAALSERAGLREATLELAEGATVADAYQALCERYPRLADYSPSLLYAVNAEYVAATHALHEGDEVAFIPPVSGG